MPPGMPPMPDTGPTTQASADPFAFLSETGTKQPADLLAGYQGARSRSTSPFARLVEAVKKPIHVAQLRRQVGGLQQALDAAWEKLGMLAIGHRSFHPHLRTELPELSALQRQVSEKQSMADSLRQAKGSNAVLKEVEAELAELRDRQRRLMIAVGQKAEASTPDIPDGPAHYAAVQRLRSSLESAERELLGIEGVTRVPAGRLGGGGSDFLSRAKMPLMAVGAVLAVILVLWGGWWLLGGLFGSGYSAEYNVVSLGYRPGLEVTVKGKAAKLAVILTSPSGESNTDIIESERMITNNATVKLSMDDPQPGRYVITVKTFFPEAVVVKKNVDFSLNKVSVESVKFHLEPTRRFGGGTTGEYTLEGLTLGLRKDGNLPVEIADASIMVGDARCQFCNVASDRVMIGQQHAVAVRVSVSATEKTREGERRRGTAAMLPSLVAVFAPGDRYLVTGRIALGKGQGQPLEFQKEMVVSQEIVDQGRQEGPEEKPVRPSSPRKKR
jgi:hypothetical protein